MKKPFTGKTEPPTEDGKPHVSSPSVASFVWYAGPNVDKFIDHRIVIDSMRWTSASMYFTSFLARLRATNKRLTVVEDAGIIECGTVVRRTKRP